MKRGEERRGGGEKRRRGGGKNERGDEEMKGRRTREKWNERK